MSEEKSTVVIADKDNKDQLVDEKSYRKDEESDSSDSIRDITPIAGIKRPAESQGTENDGNEEEGYREPKPTFKFRPATLQSGPAEKTYTDNAQSWSGGSVSSSGFILQPSKLSTPSSSGSLFKLDISHPNLTLSTASPSLSTGLLTNKSDETNTSEKSDKKNIFLQFLSTTSSSTQSSNGNFLFGSNLEDKVTVKSDQTNSDDVTSEKDDENKDASTNSNSVVFGNTSAPDNLPEIERITGEEEEENILQISAKMYVFDSTSHSWKERGRGELHLNDSHQSTSPIPQSRIVMRCSGTYKVLLNTHVWPQMMCELADRKSLRISAQDTDFKVKVFLIVSNPKHTVSLHKALLKRITQLSSVQQSSDTEESSENTTESNITSNTEHESSS